MKVNELNPSSPLNINLKQFEYNSIIDASTIKRSLDIDLEVVSKSMMEKVICELMNQFREIESKAPEEIIKAFIDTYIIFEFSSEYDFKTASYNILVTPVWRDACLVDTTSESFQLLSDYSFGRMVE